MLYILLIYLAFVFFLASRNTRVASLDEFLISRGNLNAYVLGFSFAASYASVSIFMGISGWAYNWGEAVLFYQAGVWLCTLAGLCVFAYGFRKIAEKHNPLSLADWIGKRYDSAFLRTGVSILTLWNVFYIAGQFIGGAVILETFFGLPFAWAVMLSMLVSCLFVIFGGMRVNVRSDFLQGTVMLLVAVVILGRGFSLFGWSPVALHEALAARGPEFVSLLGSESIFFNTPFALLSIIWLLFIFPANPHLMSIVLALKEPKDFRKFLLTAGICLGVFSLAPFAGHFARALSLDLEKPDAALPQFLLYAFNENVAFLLILAVLSAGLTTTSSLLVSLSGALSHDLRAVIFHDRDSSLSHKTKLRMGRGAMLVIALAAMAIALTRPPSLSTLVWIGINGVLSGVAGPLIGGIFIPRLGRKPAGASFISGVTCYLILYPWMMKNVLAAGALSSFIGVVVLLLCFAVWKDATEEQSEKPNL